ncbi:MAG TPA: FG-GAP-like repeat-containing protein [Flavipsychrobacter sp.]|nr:FG-GAP-like repeat-containing protein [Flavipsychrobacter sp.]
MIFSKNHFLLLLLLSSADLCAQGLKYQPDTSWKVFAYNNEKTLGFSGGFNNPQFGLGDLNNDGKNDLIVFEKGSLQIKTFINYGTGNNADYRYRPQYAKNFPLKNGVVAVGSYMKIENLNCDNIPDLVTRGNAGFSVYYGYYLNNALHFNYYKDLYYSPLTGTPEGFETTSFPTNGWKVFNTNGKGWSRITSGSNPTVSPKTGNGMAIFEANAMPAGNTALLVSRNVRISPNLKSEGKISLWMYRDDATAGDSLSVFINDNDTLNANATYLGGIARNRSITQPDTKPANGWYPYTFSIPYSVTGNKLYFILKGTSRAGNNIFVDDIYYITSNPFGDVNAYVDPGGDIPGIVDADKDGDLDFFSFNISGGYINFYKNYQKEENLPCDSIHINLKDACWGKVYQGFSIHQTLGVVCNSFQPVIPPAKVTHTGNTLCIFDHDGDGDLDYLNGGVSYSSLQYLENGKTDFNHARDSMIAQDTTWQTTGKVYSTQQFPAAFHIDVDLDGKKDILVSPSAELASENYNCIAYYQNTGTASSPVFTYQHDTLLVEKAIDMGSGSYPMLYDYNKDGKPDLFVGGDGFFQLDGSFKARIAYFQNTTNASSKSFTLQTNDFLNIDAQGIKGAYPAVGDLDNDGLDDLVVGHENGTISFYKNTASSANVQPIWQLTQPTLTDVANKIIDSNQYAAPLIYDIDKDGKKDLLIGGQSGYIFYYKNIGNTNQLSLQYQTGNLGSVRADPWNLLYGFSAPFVGKTDSTANEYLIVGSNSGRLVRYTGFQNGNVTVPYTIEDTAYHELNLPLGSYSGFRAVPAIADIDGDGQQEMIVGNILGGILIFTQQDAAPTPSPPHNPTAVKIYPNSATNQKFRHRNNNHLHHQYLRTKTPSSHHPTQCHTYIHRPSHPCFRYLHLRNH